MNFLEIIEKKKHNKPLTKQEIDWIIENFTSGKLMDYQMSALTMAIYFNGMNDEEIANLTGSMLKSGKTFDVSNINGFKVDKHSTGGVGDKTSLIFAPLVASFGLKVAKMSGRGLGQTGGTIDKLESFPAWKSEISEEQFDQIVDKVGISIIGQSDEIVPADKKLYALRDVTGTVDSLPLIVSSIMSKKLAINDDGIVLDIKVGSGAFIKNVEDARKLARTMISIGKAHNRKVSAMLTDMNKPLGKAIGNALEIKEVIDTLNGHGPNDLVELCTTAAGESLVQAGLFNSIAEAKKEVLKKLDGSTLIYLKNFVEAQNGDWSVFDDYEENFSCKNKIEIKAQKNGYLEFKNTDKLGYLAMYLGAGREVKTDLIDHAAGIYLEKQAGDEIVVDDLIMTLYTNKNIEEKWTEMAHETFSVTDKKNNEPIIIDLLN